MGRPALLCSLLCAVALAPGPAAGVDGAMPELQVQLGHSGGGVVAAAFSRDGRYVATAGDDDTVRLWERTSGLEVRRFVGPAMEINDVVFSPDGGSLLSGHGWTDDSESPAIAFTAHLWDVRTGQLVRRLVGHRKRVLAVAFAPDGRRAATASGDGTARVWDLATGETVLVLRHGRGETTAVSFSADGRWLLTAGDDGTLVLWDAAGGSQVRTMNDSAAIADAEFGDGSQILTRSWDKPRGADERGLDPSFVRSRTCLWDGDTGRQLRCFTGEAGANSDVLLSPDGASLVTLEWVAGGRRRLRWHKLASGEVREHLTGDPGTSRLRAISPDGTAVLVTLASAESGGTYLWQPFESMAVVPLAGRVVNAAALAVGPQGRLVAVGGADGVVHLWDTSAGRVAWNAAVPMSQFGSGQIDGAAFVAGTPWLVTSRRNLVQVWDAATGREVGRHDAGPWIYGVLFSVDGTAVAYEDPAIAAVVVREVVTGAVRGQVPAAKALLALSPRGEAVLLQVERGKRNFLALVATAGGRRLWEVAAADPIAAAFSPEGRRIAVLTLSSGLLLDADTGREVARFAERAQLAGKVAFSADGRTVLTTGSSDGSASLWDAETGRALRNLRGHLGAVTAAAVSDDGGFIATAGNDGAVRLWNPIDGTTFAQLINFKDGSWTVVAPDGRFDADDLDAVPGLHWLVPDDPLTPLAPEVFLRDYFEPRLLPRLLAGEALPALRPLADLNRVRPEVWISSISPSPEDPDTVLVEVEVASAHRAFGSGGEKASGVYDLRLFRDGRLVALDPAEAATAARPGSREEQLATWRQERAVALDPAGRAQRTFRVRLPRRSGLRNVKFSAYAFNRDRVKSATAVRESLLPTPLSPTAGRAWVITVGVAGNQHPAWRLLYPANDARRLGRSLAAVLRRGDPAREVFEVRLVAGRSEDDRQPDEILPTKANLRTVLDLLAGRSPRPEELAALPAGLRGRLAPARPEDLVVLTFSGHGATDGAGVFHLYPFDLGDGGEVPAEWTIPGEVPAERTIASDELALWLRAIDAGELALVLDTCRSGAAAGPGFKPAPLGDRGLGQLAYDKAMPILAATQADSDAIGSGVLRHGLLSYALIEELEALLAAPDGGAPVDLRGWLQRGGRRVPDLFREKIAPDRGGAAQEPVLFDFGRR